MEMVPSRPRKTLPEPAWQNEGLAGFSAAHRGAWGDPAGQAQRHPPTPSRRGDGANRQRTGRAGPACRRTHFEP